ncbi:sodium:solute symporter family protein [Streptomyces sp. NPDC056682]|uniref:sodium:solute symporter family transporter n=1 Tax=Streptomyces sp. NPDC056682 TaxID=3345909 RepID=UPI00369E6701
MSDAAVATTIFAVFMVATVVLGLLAVRGRAGSGGGLTEWSVGGRSLGTVFIWVLMAGEGYTSFSYLGAAGWGYNYGAPVLYVVAYLSCGYAVGYVVGPMLWAHARRHGLVGITDMVAHRYGRPWAGALVALLATVFLLPYIQLQITGMGVVVSTISYGALSLNWGYFIAFAVTTGFVVVSGLRGSAWVSVLKDVLVIATLAFLAIYVPQHYFGGYGDFLDRVVGEKRDWVTLPGHGGAFGQAWFATTTVLNSLTIVIFPTTVAGYLGALSSIVPMAVFMLVIGTMWGRSVLSLVPRLRERQKAASQVVVVVAGALALLMTYTVPNTLVRLSLISYEGMAQLLPMLLLGLVWRRVTLTGGLAGLAVGVAMVCWFVFSDRDPVWGVNAGVIALGVNLLVAVAVSYAGPKGVVVADDMLARDPIYEERVRG